MTDPDSAQVLLTLNVAFSGTEGGHPFATCTQTITVATSTSTPSEPSCGLGRAVWSKWVNSHPRDFSTWADPTFKVTVNSARDVAALDHELSQEQGG